MRQPCHSLALLLAAASCVHAAGTGYISSYYKNGRIYVNELGTPEGKPLTNPPGKGWEDFKPSWSKTGDMLVFFRRVQNDRDVVKWKTKICIIKTDGTGFHQLSDGTHTDFNQTWTRDGKNTPIWNRKNDENDGFIVMASKVGAKPGQEFPLTDKSYHNWAYTCLVDGRILVQSVHPKQGWGYFLMAPKRGGGGEYERVDCAGMDKLGLLDRVTLSPSETKVAFEHQLGHKHNPGGRALFLADVDVTNRRMSNVTPIANKDRKPGWFAYPRFTKDEKEIIYHGHAAGKRALYLYNIEKRITRKVSTDDGADYRYPHGEATPK
jgi:hypothetical protein